MDEDRGDGPAKRSEHPKNQEKILWPKSRFLSSLGVFLGPYATTSPAPGGLNQLRPILHHPGVKSPLVVVYPTIGRLAGWRPRRLGWSASWPTAESSSAREHGCAARKCRASGWYASAALSCSSTSRRRSTSVTGAAKRTAQHWDAPRRPGEDSLDASVAACRVGRRHRRADGLPCLAPPPRLPRPLGVTRM